MKIAIRLILTFFTSLVMVVVVFNLSDAIGIDRVHPFGFSFTKIRHNEGVSNCPYAPPGPGDALFLLPVTYNSAPGCGIPQDATTFYPLPLIIDIVLFAAMVITIFKLYAKVIHP